MRFTRGDVHPKSITDLRSGAKERRSRREAQRSTFARLFGLFDFRLLQQYLPSAAIREPHSIIYFGSARGAGPDHLLVRSNASAGALCRLQNNRMLRCRAQLVEDHRLDIERALIDESGAQARLIDQPPEQVEIGIRRQHDVNAAARLEALVGLFKQGCQVPILRAGMPAAVGEIAGLARMLWRT